MAEEECGFFDAGCRLGDAASAAATSAIEGFVKSVAEATVAILKWTNTFWLDTPTPDVQSTGVTAIQENLSWYTFVFAVIGVLIAAGRMALSQEFRSGSGAVRMIVNLIVATAVMAAGFTALMQAGDAFAPWIVRQITGEALDLSNILSVKVIMSGGIGTGLLLGVLALLGSLANVAFMILRDALILILFAFIPTLAAASASEAGSQAFKKALAWLLGFILYKPIAGVIYGLGIITLAEPYRFASTDAGDEIARAIYQTCVAVVILACAALALPAIIKFVAPAAAMGSSSAFSGGAVGGAAVATGAAVVALGATAGAGAVAAPAAAGAGAGTAGSAGSAGAAGGAAGTAAGGSSTPPPSAGTGGSGSSGGAAPASGGATGGGGSNGGASTGGGSGSASGGTATAGASAPPAGGGSSPAGGADAGATGGDIGGAAAGGGGTAGGATASGGGVGDAARAAGDVAQVGTVASGAMSETTGEEKS